MDIEVRAPAVTHTITLNPVSAWVSGVALYARQYRDFTDDANYAVRLAELLTDIRGDASATLPDAYRKTRVTYLTTPPRVANYLERPEALHALRNVPPSGRMTFHE